jgi:hypothetical protein
MENSSGTDDLDADFPPLVPEGNEVAQSDPNFVNDCLSELDTLNTLGKIEAGSHCLTENQKWGLVFRVDFSINGKSQAGLVNRLACWKETDGTIGQIYAIGQDIKPLG